MPNRYQLKYDLTGRRFGQLKVLGKTACPTTGRIAWECICDCGARKIILSQSLRKGATKSCGCGVGKATSERQIKPIRKGGRFGKLKVLDFSHQDRWGNMRYKCLCDCGNIHITKGTNLRSGKTKSCGCGQLAAVTTHGLSYTPEYYKAATYRRRSFIQRTGRGDRITATDLLQMRSRQKNRCFYCKEKLDKYHLEHKTPLSRGGTHTKANVCLACRDCNLRKHTMTAEEFLEKENAIN